MKMNFTKRFLLIAALISCFSFVKAQTILLQEDFETAVPPALPAGWVAIDNDGLTPVDAATDPNIALIGTAGWAGWDDNGTNKTAAAHSWYTPPGTSDDWLISPSVTLGSNSFLSWDAQSLGNSSFLEEYDVMISTTTPDISEFMLNPPLLSVVNEPNGGMTNHQVSLSAYAGQTVYIAFVNNSTDQYIVLVDNFKVYEPTSDDAGVTTFLSPMSNGCSLSSSENITATVKNLGASNISNFSISYSINGGSVVTENIVGPITPGNSLDYTFSSSVDLSAAGPYAITVFLSGVSGDANAINDTLTNYVSSAVSHDFTISALSMGFEVNEDAGAWKIGEDNDGNNQSWNHNFSSTTANTGLGYVSIVAPTTGSNSDDWFFTPCLSLQNGEKYAVDFSILTTGTNTRKFKIMYGSGQNAASMTQTIVDEPAMASSGFYSALSYQFTANSTGVFYIGFQDYSDVDPNFPTMAVDDILIYKKLPLDASTVGFASPSSGTCTLSSSESVQVGIFNTGTTPISGFDVSYTVNGGAPVTETVSNTIDADSLFIYTFTATADLSVPGDHIIAAYTSLVSDGALWNDTSVTTVTSVATVTVPTAYNQDFEQSSLPGWTLDDVQQDGTWFIDNNNFNSGAQSITFDSDLSNAADDWLFTSCFNFQAGTLYRMSFYAEADAGFTHDLEVSVANAPNAATMTSSFMTLSIGDNPYALKSGTFTVPSNGTYYLGFHVTSAAGSSFLSIDDVTVDTTSPGVGISELDINKSVSISPNPSKGIFSMKVISRNIMDLATIEVQNILGQKIWSSFNLKEDQFLIDLSNQPDGVYFVKIKANGETSTQKIVIAK